MTDFEAFLLEQANNPALALALLFFGPFVLEEAAVLAGAALAAAGALPPVVVLIVLYAGIVVSDWLLYLVGALAGRSRRVRGWIGHDTIDKGRRLLQRGALPAAISARLVPWLLLPIFVTSGFVRVDFLRFAAMNAAIAFIYVNVIFWGIFGFNLVLFEVFDGWGWLAVLALGLGLVMLSRRLMRRFSPARDDEPKP